MPLTPSLPASAPPFFFLERDGLFCFPALLTGWPAVVVMAVVVALASLSAVVAAAALVATSGPWLKASILLFLDLFLFLGLDEDAAACRPRPLSRLSSLPLFLLPPVVEAWDPWRLPVPGPLCRRSSAEESASSVAGAESAL